MMVFLSLQIPYTKTHGVNGIQFCSDDVLSSPKRDMVINIYLNFFK